MFRTLVSWLAVAFLLWRASLLVRHGLLEGSGTTGLRPPREAWLWSPCWMLLAFMIAWPGLRAARLRLAGVPFQEALEHEWPLRINAAGRWLFAITWAALALRWVPAGVGVFLTWQPSPGLPETGEENLAAILFPALRGVLAAMLIAPELAILVSSGFTAFIDAVFFPEGRDRVPPYSLKLARFYVEKQRWEDAEEEFARVLSYHPQQVEAWKERIAAAFHRPDAPHDTTPQEILASAVRTLRSATDREAVHAAWLNQVSG